MKVAGIDVIKLPSGKCGNAGLEEMSGDSSLELNKRWAVRVVEAECKGGRKVGLWG